MGWGFLREIARPFEQAAHGVGISGGGITRKLAKETNRIARQPSVFLQRSLFQTVRKISGSEKFAASIASGGDPFAVASFFQPPTAKEVGAYDETTYRKGRQAGIMTTAMISTIVAGGILGGAIAAGEGGAGVSEAEGITGMSSLEAGTVGEQESMIALIQAEGTANAAAMPAVSGMELEAAAGPMTADLSTFNLPMAAPGSPLLPAALSGAATAAVSQLLTKAVNTLINPLFAPESAAPAGGGGGGGSAGGYPFGYSAPVSSGPSTQFLLVAAALGGLLLVARKMKGGG